MTRTTVTRTTVAPPTAVAGRRLLLTAILAAVLVCAACSGDDGGATTTSGPETNPTPETTALAGPPPEATEQGLRELQAGDCFDKVDDPTAADRAVWLIDCEDPHSHEVFDVVTYDADDAGGGMPYPGVATVQDWAEQACYERFEAFVGTRWTLSELEIEVWWPSEDSWDRGDRTVICTVLSATGDRLTGSQRGTAR